MHSKARHTHTDSAFANVLCVCSPPTVGNTFCGHLASEKSVSRPSADGYLSADKLLATKSRYVYGGL